MHISVGTAILFRLAFGDYNWPVLVGINGGHAEVALTFLVWRLQVDRWQTVAVIIQNG